MEQSIKCVAEEGAILPSYQTNGAAGADIRAFLPNGSVLIPSGEWAIIPTGIKIQIPEGFEVQVRPRSGLSAKNGVTVLNTPGTIDSDYRGEIKVILINLGKDDFVVENGERIAQLVVSPVTQFPFVRTDSLEETKRGENGFGSTGRL